MADENQKIKNYIKNSSRAINSINKYTKEIKKISKIFKEAKRRRKNIFVCGNGGSYAEAEHFVAELVCTYDKRDRKSYPAVLLGSNNESLSAWSNDFDYKTYLCREIDALASKDDILIIMTTSGGNEKLNQSKNLLNAAKLAKQKRMKVISLTGKKGGDILKYSDNFIHIKNKKTSFVQEAHLVILHMICELLEN